MRFLFYNLKKGVWGKFYKTFLMRTSPVSENYTQTNFLEGGV